MLVSLSLSLSGLTNTFLPHKHQNWTNFPPGTKASFPQHVSAFLTSVISPHSLARSLRSCPVPQHSLTSFLQVRLSYSCGSRDLIYREGLWLSLQPQLGFTYHTSGQLSLAEALLASSFPFLSLWLRGGAEETEVEELLTMVWALRNTNLLILNKESRSF